MIRRQMNNSLKKCTLLSVAFCLITSCMVGERCEESKVFYKEYEAHIVLDHVPILDFDHYNLSGKSILGGDTIARLPARWFGELMFFWDVGDTVIKEKESLKIILSKKELKFDNKIFVCEWTCQGHLINGKSADYWQPKLRKFGLIDEF